MISLDATEDLGVADGEIDADDGEEQEGPLAPGGDLKLPSSDDEGQDTSDEEIEVSKEQNFDSELREEEDDDDDVYLTANALKLGGITIRAANFTSFATKLELRTFPIP